MTAFLLVVVRVRCSVLRKAEKMDDLSVEPMVEQLVAKMAGPRDVWMVGQKVVNWASR
jgi:uncharacterized membrane protein